MLRCLTDEDLNRAIIRGLLDRRPRIDLVLAREVGLLQTPDPLILQWAAGEGRVVITHDVNSMIGYAHARVRAGQSMTGVIAVPQSLSIGHAIDDLWTVIVCGDDRDMEGQVLYLPL